VKTIEKQGAQGDVLFRRVTEIPADAVEQKPRPDGGLTVTHSETGHDHVARGERVRLFGAESSLVAYLSISGPYADVEHLRPFDTHETLRLLSGCWEIRRQREHSPEGWRRVED
jgi:hypothetical protein